MAEIGLVASILSVAAVGTSVATTLYETTQTVRHADQDILSLARHVSESTAAITHMGEVMKEERDNCSKQVIRDIRKITHSCKRTFREIKYVTKSRRFRHFASIRWLFKRTKATELEARLRSQQSNLQCIIHTLTVAKLGRIDSRSKEDSDRISGELKLLMMFIVLNFNNGVELKRAEQSAEAEAQGHPTHGADTYLERDDGIFPHGPSGDRNAFDSFIARSPSPSSVEPNFDKRYSSSGDEVDADDGDVKYTKYKEWEPTETTAPTIHRESDVLLQIVPYRSPISIRPLSDRLIGAPEGPSGEEESATAKVTSSVRLLLDKWTASGSAPVADILNEEATKEQLKAKQEVQLREPNPRSDFYRRPSSPLNDNPFMPRYEQSRYPGQYGQPPPPHINDYPLPPPFLNQYPPRDPVPARYTRTHQRNYWDLSEAAHRKLGAELLAALRSTTGGIYHTKSSRAEQIHYVDDRPIYTCSLAPPHMMSYGDFEVLDTELSKGVVRKEVLDLLDYSYTETAMGKFAIAGDLKLSEIEELVTLSHEALDRHMKRRSEAVNIETGSHGANIIRNRKPEIYGAPAPSQVPVYSPPIFDSLHQQRSPLGEANSRPPYFVNNLDYSQRESVQQQAPPLPLRSRRGSFTRQRPANSAASPPEKTEREPQGSVGQPRPELRFVLPQAQTTAIPIPATIGAQSVSDGAKTTKTAAADDLREAEEKLEKVKKRKDAAARAHDLYTVDDITYHVIPSLETRIAHLKEQLEIEKKQRAATQDPASQRGKARGLARPEVETESDSGDHEDDE